MASLNRRTYGGEGSDKLTAESAACSEVYCLEADADSTDPPTALDVRETVQYFLGDTAFESFDGQIQRTLPLAHPIYPNMVADSVNVVPVGGDKFSWEVTDPDETLEAPPPKTYVLWEAYEFTVNYSPVPYALIRDENIQRTEGQWTDTDGTPKSYFYWTEWWRYTDQEVKSRDEIIKAKYGKMKYRSASGNVNAPYTSLAMMPLPNDSLFVTWYRVPYRYVKSTNSYLRRFRYRVNQFTWEGYNPGELLFKGYTPRRFAPPLAGADPAWESTSIASTEKLCDIVLEFIVTRRTGTDLPAMTNPPYSNVNGNWILAGHNLMPYFRDRKFYYVSCEPKAPDSSKEFPHWTSFPVELLFTDPDVPQPSSFL